MSNAITSLLLSFLQPWPWLVDLFGDPHQDIELSRIVVAYRGKFAKDCAFQCELYQVSLEPEFSEFQDFLLPWDS